MRFDFAKRRQRRSARASKFIHFITYSLVTDKWLQATADGTVQRVRRGIWIPDPQT
jgi:hypothetical protein